MKEKTMTLTAKNKTEYNAMTDLLCEMGFGFCPEGNARIFTRNDEVIKIELAVG